MQSSDAARIFYDWCVNEGMLLDAPSAANMTTPQEIGLITNKNEIGKQMLRMKQVHGVASNEPGRRIVVFTRKAMPTGKKQAALLPTKVDDVDITFRQGAPVSVGVSATEPSGGPTHVIRQLAGGQFYACGSSISVGNHREAGTFGCLVRNAAGQLFGLTNNHVSGSCNFAGVGLPILAPGVFDVVPNGLPPFTIGFHAQALTLVCGTPDNINWKDNTDAAIFRIHKPDSVTSFQGAAYDTPADPGAMIGSLIVEKVGRSTGHTQGRVVGQLHGSISVPYAAGGYGFSGTVHFEPVFAIAGQSQLFSDKGDSGSLITAVDANGVRKAVGLLFGSMTDAKAPGGSVTLALPIEPILHRFGVTLVHGHNA